MRSKQGRTSKIRRIPQVYVLSGLRGGRKRGTGTSETLPLSLVLSLVTCSHQLVSLSKADHFTRPADLSDLSRSPLLHHLHSRNTHPSRLSLRLAFPKYTPFWNLPLFRSRVLSAHTSRRCCGVGAGVCWSASINRTTVTVLAIFHRQTPSLPLLTSFPLSLFPVINRAYTIPSVFLLSFVLGRTAREREEKGKREDSCCTLPL